MKIAIACDRAGFIIKDAVRDYVKGMGHEVTDFGTYDLDHPVPFTVAASSVAKAVSKKEADRGIILCGTGMGVSIAANKFKGVYAGVVESEFAARHCRLINNCNVLCIGGYVFGEYMAKEAVKAFLTTEWTQDFVEARSKAVRDQFGALQKIEDENFK
ncbi:MAG: RpiB/LacA/LacB family sugar-phosphate isomerase [Christensenellales bacterium]